MSDVHNYRQGDRVYVLFAAGPQLGTIEYRHPDMTLVITMDDGGRTVVRAMHVSPAVEPEPAIVVPPLPSEPTDPNAVVIVRHYSGISIATADKTPCARPWVVDGVHFIWSELVANDKDRAPVQVWPQPAGIDAWVDSDSDVWMQQDNGEWTHSTLNCRSLDEVRSRYGPLRRAVIYPPEAVA